LFGKLDRRQLMQSTLHWQTRPQPSDGVGRSFIARAVFNAGNQGMSAGYGILIAVPMRLTLHRGVHDVG